MDRKRFPPAVFSCAACLWQALLRFCFGKAPQKDRVLALFRSGCTGKDRRAFRKIRRFFLYFDSRMLYNKL